VGGEIVGFVKAAAERSGDPLHTGEVHALYVLAQHQGRGLGRRLMTAGAQGLLRRNHRAMLVWVLKDNHPSRRFYERLGGQLLREQVLKIGGAEHLEVAYGWPDIAAAFGKLPRGAIVVSDYDPQWPAAFEKIRDRIRPALAELAAQVEHVGSTSVPGLAAKPVLDIDVLLRNPSDLPEAIRRLARIGYEHEGEKGIPTRHAFRAHHPGPAHHLYVCTSRDAEFSRHLALRDFLRAHPSETAAYAHVKRDMAQRHPDDIDAYMAGKDACVKDLLRRAMENDEPR
jgi:GrpB-like predicted nucleotidyltransferase (UPF0157 family)